MMDMEAVTADSKRLRQAFGCFPSGVTAVCALIDGQPVGMAASSFTPVSLTPPLVSVCMQYTSETWPRLRARPQLGLSVLAEGQGAACVQLSGKEGDRFTGVEWGAARSGAVFVHGSVAWLECSCYQELPAGDHAILLLRIDALRSEPARAPLVFHGRRFRRLAEVRP